ncbi:hypothetical protein [Streptodolium elevatio]|uniref:Uncharacterized protein n=1 Tax=Streptodolium elevatio TaxID=3157996 RepID=A0ABV3DJF7_9ACTN
MGSADDQIFVDETGRRKRWTRRVALGACIPLVGYLGMLATGVVASSPIGTPPWVAEEPAKDKGNSGGTESGSGKDEQPSSPGATRGPGGATGKPSAGAGRSPVVPVTAPGGQATVPTSPVTTAAGGPVTTPAAPSADASTSVGPTPATATTKPGNAPSAPPGQTRRPSAANSNKPGGN